MRMYFFTYPTYLSNSDIDEAESKAEAACYKVFGSYTESDQTVAAVMTTLSDSISLSIKKRIKSIWSFGTNAQTLLGVNIYG